MSSSRKVDAANINGGEFSFFDNVTFVDVHEEGLHNVCCVDLVVVRILLIAPLNFVHQSLVRPHVDFSRIHEVVSSPDVHH